jgi:hypothetical protein
MAIKEIRLPDSTVISIDESLHWPAFSTFEANKLAAVDLLLLSYVVGQRIPATTPLPVTGARQATITDTNWNARSRVNHDEAYLWYAMTWEIFSLENNQAFANEPFDLAATGPIMRGVNVHCLQRDMMLDLLVGAGIDKPQATAPLEYYGQGIGACAYGSGDALVISQGAATALELDYGTGGPVSPKNQRVWSLPIFVEPDRVTKVHVHTPVGPVVGLDQDYMFRVYLDGIKTRPIG